MPNLKTKHMTESNKLAIVGSGPAALMAADKLAEAGLSIAVFEKRRGAAWKLFVAGSSGLNISNSMAPDAFARQYSGPGIHWQNCLEDWSNADWVQFIEMKLGQKTFLGTSGRYFVETMHAAKLVRAWRRRLESMGVEFHLGYDLVDFESHEKAWTLEFAQGSRLRFDRVLLCLGGGSYEPDEVPLRWPLLLQRKALNMIPFTPMNSGFHIAWSQEFLAEADGQPFKNIVLSNAKGSRKGDLIVTGYGLEGTPVYTLGATGKATLDLKADLSLEAVKQKLQAGKENLSLIRRAQKHLQLNKTALALLFHMAKPEAKRDIDAFAELIKNFPLDLLDPRPLSESISSRGGVAWDNLSPTLELRSYPGIWLAGEMIDWEAPTGGFLIQGAVSQGAFAAKAILDDIQCKP